MSIHTTYVYPRVDFEIDAICTRDLGCNTILANNIILTHPEHISNIQSSHI
jgi:hypothetical protein